LTRQAKHLLISVGFALRPFFFSHRVEWAGLQQSGEIVLLRCKHSLEDNSLRKSSAFVNSRDPSHKIAEDVFHVPLLVAVNKVLTVRLLPKDKAGCQGGSSGEVRFLHRALKHLCRSGRITDLKRECLTESIQVDSLSSYIAVRTLRSD